MNAASTPATPQSVSDAGAGARELADFWWLWIVSGIAWSVAALVVLQFDSASVTTIGIIVGCFCWAVFVGRGPWEAAIDRAARWLVPERAAAKPSVG